MCTQATMEHLSKTRFTQPALFATSIAYLRILDTMGLRPAVVAGHSVGEYAALVAAGALAFRPGLELVAERGKAMEYAGKKNPGRMVAVLGLDVKQVQRVRDESGVEIANYNGPHQTVIGGSSKAIEAAIKQVRIRGGKAVMLPVEIASHTSLMHLAKRIMRPLIEQVPIDPPKIAFIQNWTGDYARSVDKITMGLIYQLTSPVQWDHSIRTMIRDADGAIRITEVGPKEVLTSMNRRVHKDVSSQSAEEVIFKAA
ncbi:MAG: ACP S-malonyltransferase [Candidatus Levybacteria bacterium]|nr:ACP S-malonyltransferase [Candidatus Levybacteria bacterium]